MHGCTRWQLVTDTTTFSRTNLPVPPNMASKKIYWGDGKAVVRDKLGLQDDYDFAVFEVGLYLLTVRRVRLG